MALASALSKARLQYAQRNPKSKAAYDEAVKVLPGGGTRTTLACDPFPIFIASGQDNTVTDVDGHVYKDL